MSCLGDCFDMGPPPDTILFMPPPPAPTFLLPALAPINISHCSITQRCDTSSSWTGVGKIPIDREYIEMPRKDVETNWSVTGIDDTWLLVLVASSIGVLLLGALLAMFLLKCREMNLFGGSDRCTLHSREHREIMKHTDTRDCSVLSNGNKLAIPSDAVLYHGTPNLQDNRLMWAALTPRGTQHFISENYPRNLIKYDESDDHYETIEPLRAEPGHSVATTRGYDQYETYQKDYDYEDPTPLIESYQMGSMDNPENHHYQIIGNPDMRCIGMSIGPSLRRPASISRPRVSSPTRIEHPNLPPLNLYPHKMSTLRRNTMSYRSADGTIPKYSI